MTDNVGKQREVIARNEREHDRIWNAAIELAAREVVVPKDIKLEMKIADKIRKLKK